jgi:hypothetical protein
MRPWCKKAAAKGEEEMKSTVPWKFAAAVINVLARMRPVP